MRRIIPPGIILCVTFQNYMGVAMPNTFLNGPTPTHEHHCVCSFACWWREMLELETAMEYRRSSPAARAAWDSILSAQIPTPCPALGIELRGSVLVWRSFAVRNQSLCGTLLDQLIGVAANERLELPRLAVLAAFRLHRRLLERASRRGSGSLPPAVRSAP